MKNVITASEAREISGKTLEEKIESIFPAIREAAVNKQRSLKTGWEYKEDQDLWINEGYIRTENWKKAKKELEKLGYTVSFYYNDSSIAADMYTLISW